MLDRIKVHANRGDYKQVAGELGNFSTNNSQYWDKNGKIFSADKDGQPVNMKIPTSQYLQNQVKALGTNARNFANETNPNSEAYKQKLYLTSLGLSLPLNLGSAATSTIGKSLSPILGEKIGQMTAQGISSGIASGATSGLARGAIYDQNPLVTAIQDAALFSAINGAFNIGLGNIGKAIMQYQIYNSPLKDILLDDYIKKYVAGLGNITSELRNVRAMRVGSSPWAKGKIQIAHDMKPLKFTGRRVKFEGKTYHEIWLDKDEYAPVEHAASTYAKQNKIKNRIIWKYLKDDLYMIYIDENGTPMIIGKE